ncbi:MAG: hypothetical protein H7320_23520 [Ferruginibacter sp.]|nr:hypothetical protein [Ferruginibacter sp.]
MKKETIAGKLIPLLIAFISMTAVKGYSQSAAALMTTSEKQAYSLEWLQDLYEPGVTMKNDSLVINKEAERLLNEASYRASIYPATYTWEAAAEFIRKDEIKKALWYFINLYTVNVQNKEIIIKSLLVYNRVFKMDKALMSSFYTYSLTDPEIGKIENGHSEITAPHVMENKLNSLKALLFYLNKYKTAEESKNEKMY